MPHPRVSVVIPALNASAYIGATLESVSRQTEQDYEVVVVDDGSTDDTKVVVADIARCDPRVRLIHLANNVGPGAARNVAINAATGGWIALLDADDAFHPRRLEHLLDIAARTGADMVSDNIVLCPEDKAERRHVMYSTERIPREMRLTAVEFVAQNTSKGDGERRSFGFMQPLICRHFLQQHDIRYDVRTRFAEDFMFSIRCLLAGARWWITPEAFYFYNLRQGSLTESVSLGDLRTISAMEQTLLEDAAASRDMAFWHAVRRHKRTIDHWRYTTAFKAEFKRRDFGAAARTFFENRASAQAVLRDVAANTVLKPVIPWIKRRS
jgi:succinoglycan biosynthesis protein ExoO